MSQVHHAQQPISQKRALSGFVGAILSLLATSCGGAVETTTYELGCETGTLGCSCYGNWSCNYQLSCVEEVCVDRRARPSSDTPELARSELLPDPLAAATSAECVECLQDQCSAPLETCYPEAGCIALQACVFACSGDASAEADCSGQCIAQASGEARAKAASVGECSKQQCEACEISQ